MKKRLKQIIALLLAAVMMCGMAGCGKDTSADATKTEKTNREKGTVIEKTGYPNLSEEQKLKKGKYISADTRLADMKQVAEDEKLVLYLDAEFAEFAVKDKETGKIWFSNPYDFALDEKAGGDTKEELQSLISLTYYDDAGKESTMNSFADATVKDQYTIEQLKNGFAIHLQMGYAEAALLAPDVISVDKYDELIVASISEKDAKKIKAFYRLEDEFYILREATDREKRIIQDILKTSDYTIQDMEEDLELSGKKTEKEPVALFEMSIYVELEDGDLKVTVPADTISYDKDEFYLSTFKVLKYFGAGKYTQDGYLFIPDGSGALLHYNNDGKKTALHTTTPVYGMDYALSFNYEMNSLSTQNYFPVFGNRTEQQALFGIIEDGDALATIITESGNVLTSYETVYPSFTYNATFTANYMDSSKVQGTYTYHDKNDYQGDYTIRYRLLTGDNADYVGMAKSYQSYLIEKEVLKPLAASEKANITIEVLGALEKTSTKFGIPYTESVPLTSFTQAEKIAADLKEAADIDLTLRYKGWANGGLCYGVSNEVKVEKSLGGKEGLKSLKNYTKENNVKFYPDVDFFLVRNDKLSDGFTAFSNSVRNIARETLYLTSPQAFNNLAEFQYLDYSVSPNSYAEYMKNYFKDYNKLQIEGISIDNVGTMLYADYNRNKAVNREEAKDTIVELLEKNVSAKKVLVDGGNAYTLQYATDLVNVPMNHSSYTLEDESIPFMQIVLHGYVNYAGEAMNLAGDTEEMFLRSIEYGSNPFFTVAAKDTDLLKDSSLMYYYSVEWDVWKEQIKKYADEWAKAYEGLSTQTITAHKQAGEEVYCTEYADGTVFYVNYNETDVTIDGVTVPSRSFVKTQAN